MPKGVAEVAQDWYRGPIDQTCMNPTLECRTCIFGKGPLSKWCPPAERIAKAQLDQQNAEVAA